MPDAMDVWRAGAPQIDIFGVDVYGFDFVMMCARYTQSGNPLLIPETVGGLEGAARVLYAFGRHDAIGFSPMAGGIDRRLAPDYDLISGYDLITQLTPLILEHQGNGTMSAVLLQPKDPPQKIHWGITRWRSRLSGPGRNGAGNRRRSPRPSRGQFSSRPGLTSTSWLASA